MRPTFWHVAHGGASECCQHKTLSNYVYWWSSYDAYVYKFLLELKVAKQLLQQPPHQCLALGRKPRKTYKPSI